MPSIPTSLRMTGQAGAFHPNNVMNNPSIIPE
jgi:hypothetical protein